MPAFGTVSAWVDALDYLLVDPERVTWTAEARTEYITLAMDALRESRPDAFIDEISIKLTPGSAQTAPPGILGFVGAPRTECVDEKGVATTTAQADEVDQNTITAFAAFPSCPASGGSQGGAPSTSAAAATLAKCSEWVLRGFESSSRTPGFFSVTPPVPAGVYPTIKVRAQSCAPVYSWPADANTVIQCRHKAALLEQILYYCYQTPQESELAFTRAAANAKRFETMLGFEYRMQSRYNSEYFLGRKPDGTPDEGVVR